MYFHLQQLIHPIVEDEPDPAAANALQEGLGGQFGEMRTMMLGVDWRTSLPIPKTNAEAFPEVKRLVDLGLQSKSYSFDLGDQSEAGRIFQGASPSNDGTDLTATEQAPEGGPMTIAPERPEEFAPGADADLRALIEATAEMEMADIDMTFGALKG
ncbi:hypothetical protein C1N71_14100 [Agrococcus sp. SGAir0287]|nr:manganese catalase family protein [Agrococcus sp. SGAir0287]QCR20434.1 hypothetical protein C1N71_14100 [Agrococcus sp. SGAir0287]